MNIPLSRALGARFPLAAIAAALLINAQGFAAPAAPAGFPPMPDAAGMKEQVQYSQAVQKVREANPKAKEILAKIEKLTQEFSARAQTFQESLAGLQAEADAIILPEISKTDPSLAPFVAKKVAQNTEQKEARARAAAQQAEAKIAQEKYLAEQAKLMAKEVVPDAPSAIKAPPSLKTPMLPLTGEQMKAAPSHNGPPAAKK